MRNKMKLNTLILCSAPLICNFNPINLKSENPPVVLVIGGNDKEIKLKELAAEFTLKREIMPIICDNKSINNIFKPVRKRKW